jgi:conjugative relaxase-like TrwC/TraI family protein
VVAVMSIARLSAGSGYRYLLRNIATGDVERVAGMSLTDYYAASGYPPGRWLGAGLAGLGDGSGIASGAVVTEEAMARLFGEGADPLTGKGLGRPYPVFRPAWERIADLVERLPTGLDPDEHAARIEAIEARELARPARTAVAGYDLTFTVPKSASVLWALGGRSVQQAVLDAHREAVVTVLGLIEDRFLFTRVGKHSCAQVATRGMVATAFDHWDTRAGDPNLHTHVVIANRVQGPDGAWRSVDSLALHSAAVACSEVYDDLIADNLANRLSVAWSYRDRGPRRTAAYGIDGISEELLAGFSGRSKQVAEHLAELTAEFTAERGREPNRVQTLKLRQQATLATRPVKHTAPLAALLAEWRTKATELTGRSPSELVAPALSRRPEPAAAAGPEQVAAAVEATLAGVQDRRSTWTRANLLAEAARATRHLRVTSPAERIALLDAVTEAALAKCVSLDPPEMFQTPTRFTRADGASAFVRADQTVFTTAAILEAEARLLAAAEDLDAPRLPADTIPPQRVADPTARLRARLTGTRLTPDQHAAVQAIAASGRRLDLLVGPAGSGKTATLRVLAEAWTDAHGPGLVIGLAPSATAAAQLAAALRVNCENTAKWIHESTRTDNPGQRWTLTDRQLLIVDEAAMASTAHLDTLVAQAREAGAKVLLVGDHHQLGAVAAGGAFELLAGQGHAVHLDELWRFRNRWEADATRALRAGDPSALDAYERRERIHHGEGESVLDQAFRAWRADLDSGAASVLIAADRATVAELNARAQAERMATGHVQPPSIALADANAGTGDLVVTRRNDRRLTRPDGSHVRNGDLWQVLATHPDGSMDVQDNDAQSLRLTRDYVREHVELAYATTVHRAQGISVDTAHLVVTPGMTRQILYVGMTRGRHANHVWAVTDRFDPAEEHDGETVPTHRQILERILATDGSEQSATATLRARQSRAGSVERLTAIRDTLLTADGPPEHQAECADAVEQVDRLMRLRAVMARAGTRPQAAEPPRPHRPHARRPAGRDGISR